MAVAGPLTSVEIYTITSPTRSMKVAWGLEGDGGGYKVGRDGSGEGW